MNKFSKRSKNRLHECDPRIQYIMYEVIKYIDCTILTGHRDEYEQTIRYYNNQSRVKYPNSKHNSKPSMAIDVAPYPIPQAWGEDDWRDKVKFYELKAIIMLIAAQKGIELRWGGDWDSDGDYKDQSFNDLVHFEVVHE